MALFPHKILQAASLLIMPQHLSSREALGNTRQLIQYVQKQGQLS